MKTTLNPILLLLTVLLSINTSYSQERIVKGIVTTFDSIPLVNAEVKILSSKATVQTDTLGRFTINCEPIDKIKVSAKGFSTKKVKLNEKINKAFINLKLLPNENSKEIAIGYGHVKDKNKFNAVASLHEKSNNFSQYNNMYDLIKGKFPGVKVDGDEIIIRGVHSINCSSAALIVIDGVTSSNSSLRNLEPSNVKSISILKGSDAAIYGSRGSGGVVVIQTKIGSN